MQTQKLFQRFLYCLLGIVILPSLLFANSFNELVQEKQILEKQFGFVENSRD